MQRWRAVSQRVWFFMASAKFCAQHKEESLVHLSAPLFDFCSKRLNRGRTAVGLWRFFRLVAGSNVYRNECGRGTELSDVLKGRCW